MRGRKPCQRGRGTGAGSDSDKEGKKGAELTPTAEMDVLTYRNRWFRGSTFPVPPPTVAARPPTPLQILNLPSPKPTLTQPWRSLDEILASRQPNDYQRSLRPCLKGRSSSVLSTCTACLTNGTRAFVLAATASAFRALGLSCVWEAVTQIYKRARRTCTGFFSISRAHWTRADQPNWRQRCHKPPWETK